MDTTVVIAVVHLFILAENKHTSPRLVSQKAKTKNKQTKKDTSSKIAKNLIWLYGITKKNL